jgi:hypothetical protein
MRQLQLVLLVSLLLFTVTNSCSQNNSPGNSAILGIFVASTPCTQGTRPIPGIPVNTDCELIKWKLTLFHNKTTKTPATYKLHCVYGLPKQGTTGFTGGGKQVDIEGKWTIINGTAANPNAIIYRLNDDKTNQTISLLKLDDGLLHLLDSDMHLMIGSAAWSYTMNRIDNK